MNCAVHAEQEASSFCRNCGKAMCTACARTIQGVAYCEDCLAAVMGHGRPAAAATQGIPRPARTHGGPVPGLAFALGFCPGLGAVYNGEYAKALVHIVIFGTIIAGLNSGLGAGADVALALLLAAFVFYMAIDSLHVAQARRGEAGAVSTDPFQALGKGKPVGAIVLIGLGVVFLLGTFDVIALDRIWDYWPLILIGAGVLMLWNRLGRSA